MRQAEAGARYLNVNIGARALTDAGFMVECIKAIQEVSDLPLSFDFPSLAVQRVCMEAYDLDKARGRLPVINSITEHRWDLMDLARDYKFQVILMASERVEQVDGVAVPVFGAARTVVDAFRFRNKIGVDVAIEALRDGWTKRRFTMDELWRHAEAGRMARVMRPYIEAVTS